MELRKVVIENDQIKCSCGGELYEAVFGDIVEYMICGKCEQKFDNEEYLRKRTQLECKLGLAKEPKFVAEKVEENFDYSNIPF